MGFWNDLLSAIGFGDEERNPSKNRTASNASRKIARPKLEPGAYRTGTVENIGNTFATVRASDVRAIVFIGEIANEHIDHPSSVLRVGQVIDFVLLRPNDRRPDEWIGSISAVAESRVRVALAGLSVGDRVNGRISDLKNNYVVVDAGAFLVKVPIVELAWSWVDHPSEVVSLGQTVTVKILRIELPDGWLYEKKYRRAQAIGSIRAEIPQPESPTVPMAFSALPFKLSAAAKTPAACDSVVLYLLEELSIGRLPEDVQSTTGLPLRTLTGIQQVLTTEGLVKGWRLTAKGKRLAEAVSLARQLNLDAIRGLFVSSAHPSSQFVRAESLSAGNGYPHSWPRPPFDKKAEDNFVRAADEAIPEFLIDRIVNDDKRDLLARLQADDRMHAFLHRDGSSPWKPVYVDTPTHWILAGLWREFDPIGEKPFRPAPSNSWCRTFLLVRVDALARKGGELVATLFFEPNTKTLWHQRTTEHVHVREMKGSVFPEMPRLPKAVDNWPSDKAAKHLQPVSWCLVRID